MTNQLLEEASLDLLETVPLVMRTLRTEMRHGRQHDLSVPQFRTLAFVHREPGASLTALAEHLGLTPASTSKMVDALVERQLLTRSTAEEDRRRIELNLTPAGLKVWQTAFEQTRASFAQRLSQLPEADLEQLCASLNRIKPLFRPTPPTE